MSDFPCLSVRRLPYLQIVSHPEWRNGIQETGPNWTVQVDAADSPGIIIGILLPLLVLFVIYIRYRRRWAPGLHPHAISTPVSYPPQVPLPPHSYSRPFGPLKFLPRTRQVPAYLPRYTGPIPTSIYPSGVYTGGAGIHPQLPPAIHPPLTGYYAPAYVDVAHAGGEQGRVKWGGVTVRRYEG